MSLGTKPLIFLAPLSPTLQKLKEVIEEIADSEGIEVFEVDSIEEVSQLLPTVGQSLTLVASPKKCALMLQTNRRIVKKIQSKTILLSPKNIPRKTLDKFMKVGLTECVVEPVNPKTLLYKVKLQLRSITSKEEEEAEMNSRIGEGGAQQQEEDNNGKVRMEKGVIWDEEEGPAEEKKEKKEMEEQVLENPLAKKKNTYKEEAIDGFYKSKKKKEEVTLEEEPEKKKKAYQEEIIDGHYKGKVQDHEEEIEGNLGGKRKTELQVEAAPIEKLEKPEINVELEEDLARMINRQAEAEVHAEDKKKAMTAIQVDLEKEKKDPNQKEVEDLGGHYKGKVQKGLEVEDEKEFRDKKEAEYDEEEEEREKAPKLDVVEDREEEDFVNEQEEEDFGPMKGKTKKLQIVEDNEKDYIDKEEEAVATEDDEKSIKLDVEQEAIEKDPLPPKLDVVEDYSEDNKKKNKADEIDGYLRGGAAKRPQIVTDDDDDLYTDTAKEEAIAEKKRQKEGFTVEDDEKDPLHAEKEYEQDFDKDQNRTEKLMVDDDSEGRNREKLTKPEDEDGYSKSNYKEEDNGGFTRGKGHGKLDEVKDNNNRANARADRIKTHYSSKESLKHGDQDWDAKWEKSEKQDMEFDSQKTGEKELIIEKEDLGEQTIDYGQLKKEFEGISIDGIPNKKKEYGTFDNIAEIKTYKKRVMGLEGVSEEMEFEEVDEELVDQESHQVFEPNSLGMEIAIQVLNYYYEKEVDSQKLCHFINQKVNETFKGVTVFYSFAKDQTGRPFYNGYVVNQIGTEPQRPSPAELDQLPRAERKEIEKEYEGDIQRYKQDLSLMEAEWQNKYEVNLETWKEYKTPSWKDHKFQEENNEFVFPFYEGATLMGLCVFIPNDQFNPTVAESIEAVFEVARGVIISEYHQLKGEGLINPGAKKEAPKEEKKSGLFGRLFGKTG